MARFALLAALAAIACLLHGCGELTAPEPPQMPSDFIPTSTEAKKKPADKELVWAVKDRKNDRVRSLLDDGASPEATDRYGLPVIFLAAQYGDREMMNLLLDEGAEVNQSIAASYNDDGVGYAGTRAGTPLSYAAEAGNIDTMRVLLRRGADVSGRDPEGNTPLMAAAMRNRLEAVRLLLDRGADRDARNFAGKTALELNQVIFYRDDAQAKLQALLRGE